MWAIGFALAQTRLLAQLDRTNGSVGAGVSLRSSSALTYLLAAFHSDPSEARGLGRSLYGLQEQPFRSVSFHRDGAGVICIRAVSATSSQSTGTSDPPDLDARKHGKFAASFGSASRAESMCASLAGSAQSERD